MMARAIMSVWSYLCVYEFQVAFIVISFVPFILSLNDFYFMHLCGKLASVLLKTMLSEKVMPYFSKHECIFNSREFDFMLIYKAVECYIICYCFC